MFDGLHTRASGGIISGKRVEKTVFCLSKCIANLLGCSRVRFRRGFENVDEELRSVDAICMSTGHVVSLLWIIYVFSVISGVLIFDMGFLWFISTSALISKYDVSSRNVKK